MWNINRLISDGNNHFRESRSGFRLRGPGESWTPRGKMNLNLRKMRRKRKNYHFSVSIHESYLFRFSKAERSLSAKCQLPPPPLCTHHVLLLAAVMRSEVRGDSSLTLIIPVFISLRQTAADLWSVWTSAKHRRSQMLSNVPKDSQSFLKVPKDLFVSLNTHKCS